MCPILRGKMGLKYAARAGRRGRARWAGRAEPAHGRGLRSLGRGCLSRRYWGLRPLAPLFACQRRERSEAFRGRRRAKPSDTGMSGRETRKPVKDSIYLPKRTKAVFSLESEGLLFDKTKRNLSEAPLRGPLVSAARSATASKRSLAAGIFLKIVHLPSVHLKDLLL